MEGETPLPSLPRPSSAMGFGLHGRTPLLATPPPTTEPTTTTRTHLDCDVSTFSSPSRHVPSSPPPLISFFFLSASLFWVRVLLEWEVAAYHYGFYRRVLLLELWNNGKNSFNKPLKKRLECDQPPSCKSTDKAKEATKAVRLKNKKKSSSPPLLCHDITDDETFQSEIESEDNDDYEDTDYEKEDYEDGDEDFEDDDSSEDDMPMTQTMAGQSTLLPGDNVELGGNAESTQKKVVDENANDPVDEVSMGDRERNLVQQLVLRNELDYVKVRFAGVEG
ncbi:hypothetical protein Scep_007275 [Stephania cephalantha]|uniref:Uncharacterized protein n=1 Tax=Stephania cephalantha TaxID=152367 RepID=A0AAP0KBB2_9MAGN